MATLTLTNKDIATLTLPVRHGRNPVLGDIQNLTFNDVMFPDGTLVKNVTFDQLQDQAWSYASTHPATLTNEIKP